MSDVPHEASVNGPSFLGLADEPAENIKQEFHYLYEDEPPRSHAGLIMVLLILAVAGTAVGWQWHHGGFPFNSQRTPAGQSASSSEAGSASQTRDTHVDNPATGASSVTPATQQKPVPVPTDAEPSDNASSSPATTPSSGKTSSSGGAEDENSTSAKAHATPADRTAPGDKAKATSERSTPEATTQEAKTIPPPVSPRSRLAKTSSRTSARPRARPAVQPQEPATVASPDADLELAGERYLYGTGLPQNCARADSSLRTAAMHGNTKAETVLGTMYATGHCVTRDLPTAYRWFARALHKDPQNSRISADLQVLWRQMSPQEKQMATANNPQPE